MPRRQTDSPAADRVDCPVVHTWTWFRGARGARHDRLQQLPLGRPSRWFVRCTRLSMIVIDRDGSVDAPGVTIEESRGAPKSS